MYHSEHNFHPGQKLKNENVTLKKKLYFLCILLKEFLEHLREV